MNYPAGDFSWMINKVSKDIFQEFYTITMESPEPIQNELKCNSPPNKDVYDYFISKMTHQLDRNQFTWLLRHMTCILRYGWDYWVDEAFKFKDSQTKKE